MIRKSRRLWTGSYSPAWKYAAILACLHTAYAITLIAKSSFVVEGQRYFCLFDDAMISMRYASNWADGHGLVWNVGERVEGYTNFGWTAVMTACHLLRLTPSHTCLLVQLLGIPVLWGCLLGSIRLARACRVAPLTACIAATLVITQWNLNFFTLMGMESGLLTLLVTFGLRDTVITIGKRRGSVRPFLWFAAAWLVRPDVMLIVGLSSVVMLIRVSSQRRNFFLGLVILALVVGTHLLWKYLYYGEMLPNTYYLKATGWALTDRITVGLRNSVWTALTLAAPFLFAIISLARFRLWKVLFISAFTAQCVYQVYLGGDAWPQLYRFILPATPALMILAADGILMAAGLIHRRPLLSVTRFLLAATCLLAINCTIHRNYWTLSFPPPGRWANATSVRQAIALDKISAPEARVAVTWAGALPYYSGRYCIDLMGKCDPLIAKMAVKPTIRLAGHNKYDVALSVEKHQPDVVVDSIRIADRTFFHLFRPVVVDVDETPIMFSVRKGSRLITGGKPVSWEEGVRVFEETPRM